jgi:hypothetical protein
MDEPRDVEYEYQGQTWTLPQALVRLEIELARARAACVSTTDPSTLEQARAEERRLVLEKFRTAATWRDSFAGYDRWRANEALKEYARAQL